MPIDPRQLRPGELCEAICDNIRQPDPMTRVGVYLDIDIKPVRLLDDCCRRGVAAWRAGDANKESFFKRRYVRDQAGPDLVA